MERRDRRGDPRTRPVVVGEDDRPNVLGPKVVYAGRGWRVWYRATHHEAGPGELPDTEIRYSERHGGITDWSHSQLVFDDDRFDATGK